MSPAKIGAEIDGWLFIVQRSLLHQRTAYNLSLVLAGIDGVVLASSVPARQSLAR